MNKKSRKGQAAMEYLMTYGWAILVIVIVLAALYYFLPKSPEVCMFPPEFACEGSAQIYVEKADATQQQQVFVSLAVTNQVGKGITDVKAVCTNFQSVTKDFVDQYGESYADTSPGSVLYLGGEDIDAVPCVDKDGNEVKSTAGSSFKGTVTISYSREGDVDTTIKHVIEGNVQGKILTKE
jgi:hypothetical protein